MDLLELLREHGLDGDGSFVVRFREGLPYNVSVPIAVTGGTVVGDAVVIDAGSLASSPVRVTWDTDNTGTVTVTPGQPVWVDDDDPDDERRFRGIGLDDGTAITLDPVEP